ncbi:hypothetical protein, partial [Pseudomonas sp. F9001]|uniref:hypothetical protein n=1 Tax=Pseudomonas sp. F9001 TaxID=2738823 RepID=UPI001C433781
RRRRRRRSGQVANKALTPSFKNDQLLITSEIAVEIRMLRMAHFTVALTPDLPSSWTGRMIFL